MPDRQTISSETLLEMSYPTLLATIKDYIPKLKRHAESARLLRIRLATECGVLERQKMRNIIELCGTGQEEIATIRAAILIQVIRMVENQYSEWSIDHRDKVDVAMVELTGLDTEMACIIEEFDGEITRWWIDPNRR